MNYSNTISATKKDLIEIKSRLEHIDTDWFLRDPDCMFGTKPYYSSLYYFNIKPDEAPNYIERMQRISESIKPITDKLGLEYLLSEIVQIKELARISDETYHYSFFFDLYSLACAIEEYIEIGKKDNKATPEKKANNKEHFNAAYTEDELKTLFERLTNNRYFHPDSKIETWYYICGLTGSNHQDNYITWTNDLDLLACLVYNLFGDTDGRNLWAIAHEVFRIKGEKPGKTPMKNTMSKFKNGWKDETEKFKELNKLLKV